MKLSIRMKIFLPVVILLIGFPLATWATLRYFSLTTSIRASPAPVWTASLRRLKTVSA